MVFTHIDIIWLIFSFIRSNMTLRLRS